MRGSLYNDQCCKSLFSLQTWHVRRRHQLQLSHNDTNYWLIYGWLSLECSVPQHYSREQGAQDQSLPPWTGCKTRDASKGHLIHIAVSLSFPLFPIHTGPWRRMLGDSYTNPSHPFSCSHTPPSEPLSVHLHGRSVDNPRITMCSCLLNLHRQLFISFDFRGV